MNLKSIAAHVAAYAGSTLAVLNIVAGAAKSVSLPAQDQVLITAGIAIVTGIVEAAKQLAGQK